MNQALDLDLDLTLPDRTITENELIDAINTLGLDVAACTIDLTLADRIMSAAERTRLPEVVECDITNLEAALRGVTEERAYQVARWGERGHEVGAWLALMQIYVGKALAAWQGTDNDRPALEELRKVIALGFACAEQHGLPRRVSGRF